VQINNSLTGSKGTLHGLHYQLPPAAEVKEACARSTARCRTSSSISAPARRPTSSGGVPRGFGQGLVTLTDNVEAFYPLSAFHAPEAERGLRWDDWH
jgi:dTDP-4-dehydrorhamnose 3,5-epimerase